MGDFINTTEIAISIRRDAPAARLYRLFTSGLRLMMPRSISFVYTFRPKWKLGTENNISL
ncbi:MAG: hypothetical protein IAE93_07705 [Ignavibacteria bacterium]|nr:hypothetical protein [Ignavibacteria bacterium]